MSVESLEQSQDEPSHDDDDGDAKAVQKEVENKEGRFDRQLKVLLAKQESVVFSLERLQERAPFSCTGTKTVKLSSRDVAKNHPDLEKLLPKSEPDHLKESSSCAVVGNSGKLLETQFGEAIDRHESVFRFNAAVTEGYEQFVGSKTTFRILNRPESAQRYLDSEETTFTSVRDNGDIRSWARAVKQLPNPAESSYFFDPEFLCHAWKMVHRKGEKPSSGLIGIVLALHLCPKGKIDVYGFHSSNYFSKDSRPHYYDWERPKKGRERVHPFGEERRLYLALQQHGYLKLH